MRKHSARVSTRAFSLGRWYLGCGLQPAQQQIKRYGEQRGGDQQHAQVTKEAARSNEIIAYEIPEADILLRPDHAPGNAIEQELLKRIPTSAGEQARDRAHVGDQ